MNREQLRQEKQKECDARIAQLYDYIPRLEELDFAIGQKNVAMIRSGILHKNKIQQDALQMEIEALMKDRHQLLEQYGLDEQIYKPKWDCPICEDRGYLSDGTLCSCYQQERMQNIMAQSGMSAAMQQYRFDNFYLDGFDKPEDIQKKLEWCQQFAHQIVAGTCKDCLFMRGDVGRGKTHLSSAIANVVLSGGKTVIYKRAADLFDMIRQYKYEEGTDRWHEVLEQLIGCDLLVIDDLGAERTTDFVTEQLVLLLEERNYRNKPWIINSNLKLSQIQDTYNTRVSDRIMDRATMILLERKNSYRKELAAQRMKEL
ncbi:MAG: ATP-binding protein [Peptococcaceae bacterium]|jgi:DNA replication protein DnaC|nr:ATP-binding protein [Peptococcaceae bacterium]MBQ5369419.1 ATP-binding protein [Peptococcaceae bacterium]MBQ5706877.1 ATP-binding protein [Peptococcaceae bacterium]